MAIGGAFLGGGVEVVPAGSCKLELEILTEDRANLTATFTIKGTSTYTVTAGADGRAVYTVPAGQTYTVSVNTTGYDNIASQTVIAESGTVRYVRFEAFSGRVKRSGDTMTGTLAVIGGASIDTNGQVIGKKLRATADIHLGSSPSSYAVINDGWIQNRTLDETKTDLGVTDKQDKLTAGTNITISGTTISAKDTTYDVATQSANGLMSSADKTKLDGVDSALAGKVSKSGDTMTGNLTLEKSWAPITTLRVTSASLANPASSVRDLGYTFEDSNGYQIGSLYERIATNGDLYLALQTKSNKSGSEKRSTITIYNNADGSAYANAPSWSVGTNDNSDKILTIKMANSLPSLVHTTGNETIAGWKIFTSNPTIRADNNLEAGLGLMCNKAVGDIDGWTRNALIGFFWKDYVYNGFITTTRDPTNSALEITASNGNGANASILIIQPNNGNSGWATAPTTPTNASGTEIVTANWANSKFQRKITYGTGDPPSGGQAGDVYIKI